MRPQRKRRGTSVAATGETADFHPLNGHVCHSGGKTATAERRLHRMQWKEERKNILRTKQMEFFSARDLVSVVTFDLHTRNNDFSAFKSFLLRFFFSMKVRKTDDAQSKRIERKCISGVRNSGRGEK